MSAFRSLAAFVAHTSRLLLSLFIVLESAREIFIDLEVLRFQLSASFVAVRGVTAQ